MCAGAFRVCLPLPDLYELTRAAVCVLTWVLPRLAMPLSSHAVDAPVEDSQSTSTPTHPATPPPPPRAVSARPPSHTAVPPPDETSPPVPDAVSRGSYRGIGRFYNLCSSISTTPLRYVYNPTSLFPYPFLVVPCLYSCLLDSLSVSFLHSFWNVSATSGQLRVISTSLCLWRRSSCLGLR